MNHLGEYWPPIPILKEHESAHCDYFSEQRCASCDVIAVTPGQRIKAKLKHLKSQLLPIFGEQLQIKEPIFTDNPWESRHKIKFAVGGSVNNPQIGIVRRDTTIEDLSDCPLTPFPVRSLTDHLKLIITKQKLIPHNIKTRVGELKYIIITINSEMSEGMVRFVLRSTETIPRIRKSLAELQSICPWIVVASCNIQPLPAAILEGPEEILLTETATIRERLGDVPLYFTPQSFMQVTPIIARQLYSTAEKLSAALLPASVLDLYCGVGGFSLHIAKHAKQLVGVEISTTAIASARRSALEMNIPQANFYAADVELFLDCNRGFSADLVVVNPPRRGLSPKVLEHIERLAPSNIIYSSCNPQTFCCDVKALSERYKLQQITPFDMFPLTYHWEILGLLTLR